GIFSSRRPFYHPPGGNCSDHGSISGNYVAARDCYSESKRSSVSIHDTGVYPQHYWTLRFSTSSCFYQKRHSELCDKLASRSSSNDHRQTTGSSKQDLNG